MRPVDARFRLWQEAYRHARDGQEVVRTATTRGARAIRAAWQSPFLTLCLLSQAPAFRPAR